MFLMSLSEPLRLLDNKQRLSVQRVFLEILDNAASQDFTEN